MMLCSSEISKPFWPQTLAEYVQILSGIGILFAAGTYYFNRRLKRAEWLKSLHEKFYEDDLFKKARKWVDYGDIEKELANDSDHEKEEKFADYLNFFEFIGVLENIKQISLKEIRMLFTYYLTRIDNSKYCRDYILKFNYEYLGKLLKKMKENKYFLNTKNEN